MSKNIIICAVLVFFALSMNVALSQMQYPQEMNQVSKPYPDATITQTVMVPGNLIVGMESNDNLEKILEFYKTNLVANGWTISAETSQQGHSGLIGEKGENNAVVNISTGQSGKSIIMLMLAPKK
jgi:uncharacterized membrane protein affecting hemolysin expression